MANACRFKWLGMVLLWTLAGASHAGVNTGSSRHWDGDGDWYASFEYDYREWWDGGEYEEGTGPMYYSYENVDAAMELGYRGDGTEAVIPATLTCRLPTKIDYTDLDPEEGPKESGWIAFEAPVRGIGSGYSSPFKSSAHPNLLRVVVPSSVQLLNNYAFDYCEAEVDIDLSSLTNIGNCAFHACPNLKARGDLENVLFIDSRAFEAQNGIPGEINLASVERLERWAFNGCSGLKKVVIGGRCTVLKDSFSSCGNLEYAVINATNLTICIYSDVFRGCWSLRQLELGGDVKLVSGRNPGWGFHHFLHECPNLSNVVLRHGIISIPDDFLRDSHGDFDIGAKAESFSVVVESPVEYVGENAFANPYITDLSISFHNCELAAAAFRGCRGIKGHLDLSEVMSIPMDCWEEDWDDEGNDNGHEIYCGWQFEQCTNLESVTWTPHVPTIPYGCFGRCTGLKTVNVPKEVTEIATEAFASCTALEDVWFEGAPPETAADAFAGVKQGARGHYTTHAAEWEEVIDENGMWRGLLFRDPPPPELRVHSADPMEGNLTLAWTERIPVPGVTYSIYRGEGNSRLDTYLVTNGLTETTWMDPSYREAKPLLKPLNYWVVANDDVFGERESNQLTTRRRFGVFVGLNEEQGFASDARLCHQLASETGEFFDCTLFTGEAVDSDAIRRKVADLAEEAQPGDLFLLFISSHGEEGKLAMSGWFDNYNVAELQKDVRKFDPGVAVIGVVMACHSGSMLGNGEGSEKIISWLLDAGVADCRANIAWVTSCGDGQESPLFGNGGTSPTPFGCSFLRDGWQKGFADRRLFGTTWTGDGDGQVTFYELARYAGELCKGYSDYVAPAGVRTENDELLMRVVAGAAGSGGSGTRPDAPASCTASQGRSDACIQINWELSNDSEVQYYWLFRKEPGESGARCVSRNAGNGEFSDPETLRQSGLSRETLKNLKAPEPFKVYQYYVRAVSPEGISAPSPITSGFAGTTLMRQWLEEMKLFGTMAGEIVNNMVSFPDLGGDTPWFWQTETIHGGTVAAQSGSVSDGQSSWMQLTVQGPGTIGFCWKTSCEEAANNKENCVWRDHAEFLLDDTCVEMLAGQGDWQYASFDIGSGTHVLCWAYNKDQSGADGDDCVWVDEVTWTPTVTTQTVTFNANGGTCGTGSAAYAVGESYWELPVPTKGVYPFVGWFTAKSGGEQVTAESVVPAMSARTLYAHWAKNQAVTFDANGGTCKTAKKGYWTPGTYGTLPVATREEYAFTGWYTAASGGTQVKAGDATTEATSRTLYAHWTRNQTVTFDANGGTCGTSRKGYWVAGTYATLPTATNGVKPFVGWFTEASGGEQVKVGDTVPAVSARTLYAHWAKNQAVTFDANGGTCATKKKGYWTPGTYATLPTATNGVKPFLGWFTAANGGTQVKVGDATSAETSRTLYAHWAKNQAVTFDANGGTCVTKKKGYWTPGTYATLPTPTNGVKPFVGWFTAASGGTQVKVGDATTSASSRTLYAHWAKNQAVTFDANGGTCNVSKKGYWTPGTYGTLPVATRDGFAFAGWFTAAEGGTQVKAGDAATSAGSRTLYAHWTAARQKAAGGITGIAVAPGTNGVKPRGTSGEGEGVCILLVEAQAGVEYVVQWTGALGGEWETVKRWTAEADGEAEVEVPLRAGESGAGFYRVAGSE